AAKNQIARKWKSEEEPSVDNCLIKLQEYILWDNLTKSLKGESATEFENQWGK
ncbi:hypothetical protein JRQ81_012207, partial [Phrynocephalus forsythii]